ncbi:MAG: hypothetical protein Q4B52_05840 [Tissierellia bacterium]|nr:hypothetical protein [Tissierellia bacterium]
MKYEQRNEIEQGLTNQQFEKVIKLIIELIKNSKSKEEAIKKIEELLLN